jgi:hypothetical protein
VLEFGEGLFDGVQVGAVGGQKQEAGTGCADGLSHRVSLVAAEVVEHDDVAWLQGWDQHLRHPGVEGLAIDGTVEHAWRIDPIAPQGGDER